MLGFNYMKVLDILYLLDFHDIPRAYLDKIAKVRL